MQTEEQPAQVYNVLQVISRGESCAPSALDERASLHVPATFNQCPTLAPLPFRLESTMYRGIPPPFPGLFLLSSTYT